MSTRLAEYYNELQRREGLEPVELITEWAQHDTDAISAAFRNAVVVSRITEQGIPIRAGSTNQSIGKISSRSRNCTASDLKLLITSDNSLSSFLMRSKSSIIRTVIR
jgi:hypothetical protein